VAVDPYLKCQKDWCWQKNTKISVSIWG